MKKYDFSKIRSYRASGSGVKTEVEVIIHHDLSGLFTVQLGSCSSKLYKIRVRQSDY
jgi:hypothetical protein